MDNSLFIICPSIVLTTAAVTFYLTRLFAPRIVTRDVVKIKEVLTHSREVTLVSIDYEYEAHQQNRYPEMALQNTHKEMVHMLIDKMVQSGLVYYEEVDTRGPYGQTIKRLRIGTHVNNLEIGRRQPLTDPWSDTRPRSHTGNF